MKKLINSYYRHKCELAITVTRYSYYRVGEDFQLGKYFSFTQGLVI